jgi:hypothetical protein
MKSKITKTVLAGLFIAALGGIFFADVLADFTVPTQSLRGTAPVSQDLLVTNVNNTVPLTINKGDTLNTNFIELRSAGSLKFAIPSNGLTPIAYGGTGTSSVAGVKRNLGIDTGSCVSSGDGTVTQAFAFTFASAPKVFLTQTGTNNWSRTNVAHTITTTNFIVNTTVASVTNQWLAIGAP